jgi:hypothetical protein
MTALDEERSLSPRTYYNLRRELEEGDWIEALPAENPGRENPHRIRPDRLEAFRQATIDGNRVERPVLLDKFRLFDLGLRFAGLAQQARDRPAVLDELQQALETLKDAGEGQAFYPGFLVAHLSNELLELAAGATTAKTDTRAIDLGGLAPRIRTQVEGWLGMIDRLVEGAFAPALGPQFAAECAGTRCPPKPAEARLLIRLGDDGGGQVRLSAAVTEGWPEPTEIRYGLAGTMDRFTLLAAAGHWENDRPVTLPENRMEALSGLTISLVASRSVSLPPAVFSVTVRAGDGASPPAVVVQSSNTGLVGVVLECLLDGAYDNAIPAAEGDHWEVTLRPEPIEGPKAPEFALWVR